MSIFKQMMMASMVVAMVWTFNANCAPRTIYVRTAPPAVRVEAKPAAPYKKAVWIPGRWAWKRGKYVWIAGHWVKPKKGYTWVPGHWLKKRRGWVWIEGHWRKR